MASTERKNSRMRDISESYYYLMEIATQDPVFQHCMRVLESTCLAQDIEIQIRKPKGIRLQQRMLPLIDGTDENETMGTMDDDKQLFLEANAEFRRFVNLHYRSFCMSAIRCFFVYGFVPWTLRKLKSGDIVPEVLPHGSFTWKVIPQNIFSDGRKDFQRHLADTVDDVYYNGGYGQQGAKKKQKTAYQDLRNLPMPPDNDASKILRYRIYPKNANIQAQDTQIYEFIQPNMNIAEQSLLTATVNTPLAQLITQYKNLRSAQIRRSYADAWNCTARVATVYKPHTGSNQNADQFLINRTEVGSRTRHTQNYSARDAQIEDQFQKPSNHTPTVFNLPMEHDITQLSALQPVESVTELQEKFGRDVCSVIGVPYEMLAGRGKGQGQETSTRAALGGRIFSATIQNICKHLESLMADVYERIYGIEARFNLTALPRLDVESIQDLKTLFEIGAITPDAAVNISKVLISSHKTGVLPQQPPTQNGLQQPPGPQGQGNNNTQPGKPPQSPKDPAGHS